LHVAFSLIVVPANAGIHTPRPFREERLFDGFRATPQPVIMGPGSEAGTTSVYAAALVSTRCASHDEMVAGIKPTRPYSTNWTAPLSGPREP
jgi:hypothetical protein